MARSQVSASDSPIAPEKAAGVTGNSRITGAFGAVIFVLLFLEGITVLRVRELITMHVFVGMLLVPFVIVKIASTGYRFARYYRGHAAFVDKGPPPLLLRLLGPVVVGTTVSLFVTGIALILTRRRGSWLLFAHKVSFVLWFGAMTVHILGHALETPRLAIADLRRSALERVPGTTARIALMFATLVVALAVGVISLGWVQNWRGFH